MNNKVAVRIAARWDLSEAEAAKLGASEGAEIEEDRLANLFRIYEALFGVFRDADAEREWIRVQLESFGGKSCLDRMLQGGTEDLADVRRVIEHMVGR